MRLRVACVCREYVTKQPQQALTARAAQGVLRPRDLQKCGLDLLDLEARFRLTARREAHNSWR